MFVMRAGLFLAVVSYFDNPISVNIWLISCDCEICYFSLSTLSVLTLSKSLISTSPVISKSAALMPVTIGLSSYSSSPYII